jgi:hypothetical protein
MLIQRTKYKQQDIAYTFTIFITAETIEKFDTVDAFFRNKCIFNMHLITSR